MEPTPVDADSLAELGGKTVRLVFLSSTTRRNKPRTLWVSVAPVPEGFGGEATVFKVEPSGHWSDEDYDALGITRGTPLIARFSSKLAAVSPRRSHALQRIINLQQADPESMIGMVSLYGFGKVDRIKNDMVQGITIRFDLMPFAGTQLDKFIGHEPGHRWAFDPGLTAAAFLPAARALAAVHVVIESLDGPPMATAHRDIKPANLLVVWPESKAYRHASGIAGGICSWPRPAVGTDRGPGRYPVSPDGRRGHPN